MEELELIRDILRRESYLTDAAKTVEFDQTTSCPEGAMEEKNAIIAYLQKEAFKLRRDPGLVEAVRRLYEKRQQLGEWERGLVDRLYRMDLQERNITPDIAYNFSITEKKAYTDWEKAKDMSDYSLFKDSLAGVIGINKERCKRRVLTGDEKLNIHSDYDMLLDLFERGVTTRVLDPLFEETKERLGVLLRKIRDSKKKIRTDFLYRNVPAKKQLMVTERLMAVQGFDFNRGASSESEHAYTERLSANDIRITTHIYPELFLSNIYTTLHETGHAIFDQSQTGECMDYFLGDNMTYGMHESVSRFYENILGRSREFIGYLYTLLKETVPEAIEGVSWEELYEAANLVEPSLIRTEADEVTYAFHIIIRYELEKEFFDGSCSLDELPVRWNEKYEAYLGIKPDKDSEGVLQDDHWTSDFGYFPTYLLGNFYNAMYYCRMRDEIDVDTALGQGDFSGINGWMSEHVFKKASLLSPVEWIRDITGRDLTADDFLTYLENKYSRIYEF